MERRTSLRIQLTARVVLTTEDSESVDHQTANVSLGGMFIPTHPLPLGSRVSFALDLDGQTEITGKARVVWSREASQKPERPVGMGLELLAFQGEGEQLLSKALEQQLRYPDSRV